MRWHLIGHLQRNKVKALEEFVLLHSLDSPRLADAVCEFGIARGTGGRRAARGESLGRGVRRAGTACRSCCRKPSGWSRFRGFAIRGVMTMASFTATEAQLHRTFAEAREAREALVGAGHPAEELSMGMSNDYEIAVEEGATMVRLGTTLFGARAK